MAWSAAITVLAAAVISRLLAVNLIPVITNDSVGYLSQAQDLFSDGLVRGGYRQVGYPLFLASTDIVGTVLRLEPVLMTAAIQRLLLSIGIAYSVCSFPGGRYLLSVAPQPRTSLPTQI